MDKTHPSVVATLLLAAALSAGCAAHMMETHGDKVSLFSLGQERPGRGGVIRYLRNGPAVMSNARRADAEKQMTKFCGGGYSVIEEGPRSKFGASMPIGGGGLELDQYQYVRFECASPTTP